MGKVAGGKFLKTSCHLENFMAEKDYFLTTFGIIEYLVYMQNSLDSLVLYDGNILKLAFIL